MIMPRMQYIWIMKMLIYTVFTILSLASCHQKQPAEEKENSITDSISIESEQTVDLKTLIDAPEFSLTDLSGKQKSLVDYRGKYIFMDIWATWCGPCRMQIPAMKELEKKYEGKNLVFLSISVDPEKDKSKWKTMIAEENMAGEHLFAGHESGFGEVYEVEYIPRFLFIDPNGKILLYDAPQPMDPVSLGINPALTQILDMIK